MSGILDNDKYAAARAIIEDVVAHEGGRYIVNNDDAVVVDTGKWKKCLFADIEDIKKRGDKWGLSGPLCVYCAPLDAPKILSRHAAPCRSYVYLKPMPPAMRGDVTIKRLAPTLAGVVLDSYHAPGDGYTLRTIEELMRGKGMFGAIVDGALAGYIGRHDDGSMGMLEVFERYRRRGVGGELEKFLINYIMTFGRVPHCDVFADNAASAALQEKLGLTPSDGYTFWLA